MFQSATGVYLFSTILAAKAQGAAGRGVTGGGNRSRLTLFGTDALSFNTSTPSMNIMPSLEAFSASNNLWLLAHQAGLIGLSWEGQGPGPGPGLGLGYAFGVDGNSEDPGGPTGLGTGMSLRGKARYRVSYFM